MCVPEPANSDLTHLLFSAENNPQGFAERDLTDLVCVMSASLTHRFAPFGNTALSSALMLKRLDGLKPIFRPEAAC